MFIKLCWAAQCKRCLPLGIRPEHPADRSLADAVLWQQEDPPQLPSEQCPHTTTSSCHSKPLSTAAVQQEGSSSEYVWMGFWAGIVPWEGGDAPAQGAQRRPGLGAAWDSGRCAAHSRGVQ